jgi:hypothetical protein
MTGRMRLRRPPVSGVDRRDAGLRVVEQGNPICAPSYLNEESGVSAGGKGSSTRPGAHQTAGFHLPAQDLNRQHHQVRRDVL